MIESQHLDCQHILVRKGLLKSYTVIVGWHYRFKVITGLYLLLER